MRLLQFIFVTIFAISISSVYGQNYNPLSYAMNGTPTNGVKIKTNIPFAHGLGMPTVILEGYAYGEKKTINITLNWYVYNNIFHSAHASSSGSFAPNIKLANDSGKVSIYIDERVYFMRFNVRVFVKGKEETAAMFEGWTTVDEPISGASIREVPYESSLSKDVVVTNGKVGIGTTNPTSKLEVNGGAKVNGILDTKGIDITGITRRLDTGWAETDFNWVGHSLVFGTKPKTYAHNVIEMRPGGADRGELASLFKMHQAISEGQHELRVQIDSRTSSPTFFNAGNVGIGTTTPKNKLSVNGTIWAKKVTIQLTDAADWVFEEDYNLRPLSEVANFIKTHKHLPEIPSAEEFRANDMEVSQMTNKLLQKIEELTLYTIAQEKKIEEQNEKLDTLLNRLEALEQSKN